MTAEEAATKIKSGDRVVLGHACGEPGALVEAMVNNAENYKDVEIVHMFSLGACAYCRPEMKEHFRHNALFVCGPTREAVNAARGDVDYIVTEYGIAHLKGQTLRERAKRLIAIAHPDFREELMQEFNKRFEVKS